MKKHIAILLAVALILSGCVVRSDEEVVDSTENSIESTSQQSTENTSEDTSVTENATEQTTESVAEGTEANGTEDDDHSNTEPVKPTEAPAKPTEPPVKPTEPAKPTEPPVKPTEPAKPTEPPVKPTEPAKPTEPPTNPTEPTKPTEPPVTATLTLGASSKTLYVGETYQIPYTYTGTGTLTWVSIDDSVASVSSSGKVTAKKKGAIDIEVSDGTLCEYIEIIVREVPENFVTSIKMLTSDGPFFDGLTDYAGDYVWAVFRTDDNATNSRITASSSNSAVVSVSSSSSTGGYNNAHGFTFKFKAAGTATITVRSDDGAVTLKYQITVKSGYSCAHGGGIHTPEQWAECATNVACANGMTKDSSLGSWRLLSLSAEQLTFSRAVKNGEGFVHDYWDNDIRYCYFKYVGQDESGRHQFYICWG